MDINKISSNISGSNSSSNEHQVVQRTESQGSERSTLSERRCSRRSSISGSRKASLVITPETVPQFVIPSLGNPAPRRASATSQAAEMMYTQDVRRHHSFTEALLRHDNTGLWPAIGPLLLTAQHSRKDSTDDDSEANELQVPFTKERSSSDASSRYLMPPTWDNLGECRKATSDPGFQLSMTMSHLSVAVTPYGFPTLSQAPKTDRKESLLLSVSPSKQQSTTQNASAPSATASTSTPIKQRENGHPYSACAQPHTPDNNNNNNNKITVETRRRFVRQLTNDSSVSSSGSTCTAASETWEDSDEITGGRSVSESCTDSTDSDTACDGPHSTASSPENSPTASPAKRGKFRRCHTITGTTPPSFRRKRLSDAGKDGRAQTLQHLHLHCARQGQSKDLGEIHLSFNYDRTFKLLKVIMLRAENIGRSEGASSEEVSSFAKIYLMPGKRQPQQTRLIPNTCDPEFNEIFYYKNISLTDLRQCQLRVKLNRSKRAGMGEAWIPLAHLEHQPVMLVREDLHPKSRSEVRIGCIDTSILLLEVACFLKTKLSEDN